MLLAEHGLDNEGASTIISSKHPEPADTVSALCRKGPSANPTSLSRPPFYPISGLCDSFIQVGVYFNEIESSSATKYVPRSVQIDLEDGVCNRVSIGSAANSGSLCS